MSQTILDEYLASIDEEDDATLPDPKPYGFNSIAAMLTEAQDAMMTLGETISIQKRTIAQLEFAAKVSADALSEQAQTIADLEVLLTKAEWKIEQSAPSPLCLCRAILTKEQATSQGCCDACATRYGSEL